MYKVTFKNKQKQTECFVITDYQKAMQGVVKDLLNKGYQLTIKKMEEKPC